MLIVMAGGSLCWFKRPALWHIDAVGGRPPHLKLEQAGLIKRQPGVARSITLAIDPKALPELDPRHDQPVKITVPRY
jgi:hypothetical protein